MVIVVKIYCYNVFEVGVKFNILINAYLWKLFEFEIWVKIFYIGT